MFNDLKTLSYILLQNKYILNNNIRGVGKHFAFF